MKNKLILSVIVIRLVAVLVVAQTQEELTAELLNLEQELIDANYSWLVDFHLDENQGVGEVGEVSVGRKYEDG